MNLTRHRTATIDALVRSLVFGAFLFVPARASASDDDIATKRTVTKTLQSPAEPRVIESVVCALRVYGTIGTTHTFDVRAGTRRCDAGKLDENALPLVVRVEPRGDGSQDVIVEAEAPDDTSLDEVREAVAHVAGLLATNLANAPAIHERHWYGWQIILSVLAVDVSGTAAMFGVDNAANHMPNSAGTAALVSTAVLAVSAHIFVGPIIHLLNNDPRNAIPSLGVELGLPIATALFGMALGALGDAMYGGNMGWLYVGAFGAIPGAVIAPIVDASAFSTKDVVNGPTRTTPRVVAVTPTIAHDTIGLGALVSF